MKKPGIIVAQSSKAGTPQKSPRLAPATKQRPILTQLTDEQLTNYLKCFVTISDYKQIDQGKQLLKLISEEKNEKKIQQAVQIICYFFQHAQSEGRVCGLQFMKQLMEVKNLKVFLLIEKYLLQYIIDAIQYRYNIKSISRCSTYFLEQVDKHEKDSKITQLIRMSNTYCRMSHEILYIWGAKYFPNSHFGIVYNKLSKYCIFPTYPTDFRFYREQKIIQTINSQKVKEINLYIKSRKSIDIASLSSRSHRSNRSNKSRKSMENKNNTQINKKQPNNKKQQQKQQVKQPVKQNKNIIPKLPLKQQKIQQIKQPQVIRQQPQKQSQTSSQIQQQQDQIFKSQNTHSTFIQKGSKIVSKPKNKLAQKQKIPRNVIYRQSSIEDPQDLTGQIDQINKKTRLKLKNNVNNKDIQVPMGIISEILDQNSSKANQTNSNMNSHQSQHNKTSQIKSNASKSQKSGKNTPNSPNQAAVLQNAPHGLKKNLSVIEDIQQAELGQSQNISPDKNIPQKQEKNPNNDIKDKKIDEVGTLIQAKQNPGNKNNNTVLNLNKDQNTRKDVEKALNKKEETNYNKQPSVQQQEQSQRLRGSMVQSEISSQIYDQQSKQQQKDQKQSGKVNTVTKIEISQKIRIEEINKTDFPSVILPKKQNTNKGLINNEKKSNSHAIQSKQQHKQQRNQKFYINDIINTNQNSEEIKYKGSTQKINQNKKEIPNQRRERLNNIVTFDKLPNNKNKNVDYHKQPVKNEVNQKVLGQKKKEKQQNRYKTNNYTQKSQQQEPNKKIPAQFLSQTDSHQQKSIKKYLRSTSIKKSKVFESSSQEQQNKNGNPPNKKYSKTKLTYNHAYQYEINKQSKLFSNLPQTPQIKQYSTKKDKISRFHKFRQVSLNYIPERDNKKQQQQKQQIQNKQQQIQMYKKKIQQKQQLIQKQAKLSQLILSNIENLQDKLTAQKQYIDGIKSSILDEIQSQQQKISKDHTQSAWEIKQMLKQKQILTPIYQNSLSSTKKHRFSSKNTTNSIPLQSFFGESKNIEDNSYLPGYNSQINMKKRSKSNSSKRSSNSSIKIKEQIDLYQQGTMLYCMAKRKAYFS